MHGRSAYLPMRKAPTEPSHTPPPSVANATPSPATCPHSSVHAAPPQSQSGQVGMTSSIVPTCKLKSMRGARGPSARSQRSVAATAPPIRSACVHESASAHSSSALSTAGASQRRAWVSQRDGRLARPSSSFGASSHLTRSGASGSAGASSGRAGETTPEPPGCDTQPSIEPDAARECPLPRLASIRARCAAVLDASAALELRTTTNFDG